MKCLVVVDMQNDFIDGSLGTVDAQAIVDKVVQKINEFDGMIAVTYDTHRPNYLESQEGHLLPVEHCIDGTDGWKLNQAVYDAIDKRHDGGTPVEAFLKPTFGSMRLCTDICVISNALLIKAHLPEAKITVDAACCAGVTPESHENALRAMKMCQVNIENWEGR